MAQCMRMPARGGVARGAVACSDGSGDCLDTLQRTDSRPQKPTSQVSQTDAAASKKQ
jgi:hypothetical protein